MVLELTRYFLGVFFGGLGFFCLLGVFFHIHLHYTLSISRHGIIIVNDQFPALIPHDFYSCHFSVLDSANLISPLHVRHIAPSVPLFLC